MIELFNNLIHGDLQTILGVVAAVLSAIVFKFIIDIPMLPCERRGSGGETGD